MVEVGLEKRRDPARHHERRMPTRCAAETGKRCSDYEAEFRTLEVQLAGGLTRERESGENAPHGTKKSGRACLGATGLPFSRTASCVCGVEILAGKEGTRRLGSGG